MCIRDRHYPRRMETGKDHSHPQTKQRSDRRRLLQTNFTAISNSKNLGKSNSPLHNLKHTTNQSPTWLQNFPLNHYDTSSSSSSSSSFNVYLVVSAHVRVRRFPAILSFHNSR